MKKFVEAHSNKRYTVFDFDWSADPMNFKSILLCILGMQYNARETKNLLRNYIGEKSFMQWFADELQLGETTSNTERDFVEKVLLKIFNSHGTLNWVSGPGGESNHDTDRLPGYYFHPAKSLLNYSCDTNIYQYYENRKRIVWIIS